MKSTLLKKEKYRNVTSCRVCSGANLERYLDLGAIPLVNSYVDPTNREVFEETFPLEIDYCLDCSHSQLSIVVNAEILYQNYFYRSSISNTFIEHCYELALYATSRFELGESDLILDIASNDGCALEQFQKFGLQVLGIDPADNLANIATRRGIPTVTTFWDIDSAKMVLANYGKAKFINAMNVFAHVDDLAEFLLAVDIVLDESGIFVFEVPYLFNFINKTEFDTTYHEHLSYFLVKPLIRLLANHGLTVFDIQQFDIHGGSIRVFVSKPNNNSITVNSTAIEQLLELEKAVGLHELATYLNFPKDVERIRIELLNLLWQLKTENKTVAAYGASAKGTVLSNYCGINQDLIEYVIDDTPEKQGYLTPGSHIKIVTSDYLETHKPDYLLLFAWNFAEELIEKTQQYRKDGGRYIIPIPSVRVI